MAVWRDGVSITVEIAFATAPLATTPTWTDVTAYVREVPRVSRGRTSEYSDFAPGMCEIVLDNRDRRFDPDYSAGAYNPNVVPMKRVKVTWAFAAASGLVFTGFILGWPQEEDHPNDGHVRITAVDGSRFLENNDLADSAYAAEVLADDPVAYLPLQGSELDVVSRQSAAIWSDPGTAAALSYVDGSDSIPTGSDSFVQDVDGVPGFRLETGSSWSSIKALEFWVDDLTAPTDGGEGIVVQVDTSTVSSQVGVTWNSGSDLSWGFFYDNADDDVHMEGVKVTIGGRGSHHVALHATASTLTFLIDGQTVYTDTLSGTSSSAPAADGLEAFTGVDSPYISHVAAYSTAPSIARLQAHYLAGAFAFGHPYGETSGTRIGRILDEISWPAADRDIDTGATVQGPYLPNGQPAMTIARQVERSEAGLLFFDVSGQVRFKSRETLWTDSSVATFTDDGNAGDLKYFDAVRGSHHDTIRNIVTASWRFGAITRKDATSIAAYGEARESIDSPTINDATQASNLSAYVLRQRKDPSVRIESLVAPLRISGGDNEAEKLLAIEIGDKVTVERTPVGVGSQVVKTLIVQGVEHSITVEQWLVTLYLSPAPTSASDAPYLTLGDATYGKIGAVAGNLIPF